MGTYKEISAQTRQNLMNAFWQIYREKRIEKITVREITAKAGYNRGTFYEYFVDVYDVLEQIEQSLVPSIADIPPILPMTAVEDSPIDFFIDFYEIGNEYYTVLLGDSGDPSFAAKIKNNIKGELLSRIANKGTDTLELEYSLEYLLSAMMGVLTYWFKNGGNISRERLVALMYRLMSTEELNKLAARLNGP
jgi:AcrR family transcriptional regulator